MTQNEIAKKLGVSQASVSYVLKGGKKVSEELRRKVLALANEGGGLRKNPLQRGARKPAIGLFYSGSFMMGENDLKRFTEALGFALQEELLESGRDFRHYVDLRLERLLENPPKQLAEDIQEGMVSSLIALNLTWKKETWSWLGKLGVPVVAPDKDFGWGAASVDFEKAGFDAAERLAKKGCRKIELLSSCTMEWISSEITDKLNRPLRAGIANALRPYGVKAPEPWLTPEMLPEAKRSYGAWPSCAEQGRELFRMLYELRKPDGVVIDMDVFGSGAIKAIDELGLELGKDIQAVLLANEEFGFPGNERFDSLKLSARGMAKALAQLAQAAERGEPPKETYLRYE